MEKREDLKSILPYLPFSLRSSSLVWPAAVAEALTDLSKGPHHSKIDSGEVLFIAISDIRNSLSLHDFSIDTSASQGFALFFDDISVSGLIEDQSREAIEVDFANMYLGGGALVRGCVQEEIRFMINPELIAGMLFLPCMADNEAIEIVGTERFSSYTGYASSFRFNGDYVDKKDIDVLGRRKTRIVAIDALCCPGKSQYRLEGLLREINKAFCGYMDQCKCHQYQQLFKDDQTVNAIGGRSIVNLLSLGHTSTSSQATAGTSGNQLARNHEGHKYQPLDNIQHEIGVVTGNWGCGAFGGDPQLKAMLQWIAASQAMRPFILYYTFGLEALQMLEQVIQWIVSHKWTAGELWNVLVEYSSQRLGEETRVGFFNWLLRSLSSHDDMLNDSYDDRTCSCC
ncbi:hypothetical protein KY285_012089 [Solanum tuberosum]|nr:hypothetical protein KY285_012089 [Solanum tuberosum]